MTKKVEVKEYTRSSHNPFTHDVVVVKYDDQGNQGKGVGKTEEQARSNADAAYNTATKNK